MLAEAKRAWRKVMAAWRERSEAQINRRYYRQYRASNMTADQQKAFNEAFQHMDKAFEALRRIKD